MKTVSIANEEQSRRARRGLAVYFAILVPLSALLQTVTIRADLNGGENGLVAWVLLMAALMAVPTVASVVARLLLKEGFADVSFRFGGRRGRSATLLALVAPLVIGSIVYGIGWSTGLIAFRIPPVGIGGWAAGIVIMLMLNALLSTGEEVGWRGYMLTRLIDAGVPRPVLASGLIWGSWHIPLVLWAGFADGPSPLLSVILLMIVTLSLGYLLARVRLETRSVWPAVVLHIVWNVVVQALFDPASTGAGKALWVGETGVITALALVVVAVIYSRGYWTVVRRISTGRKTGVQHVRVEQQIGAK